jgi:hypothetical protein
MALIGQGPNIEIHSATLPATPADNRQGVIAILTTDYSAYVWTGGAWSPIPVPAYGMMFRSSLAVVGPLGGVGSRTTLTFNTAGPSKNVTLTPATGAAQVLVSGTYLIAANITADCTATGASLRVSVGGAAPAADARTIMYQTALQHISLATIVTLTAGQVLGASLVVDSGSGQIARVTAAQLSLSRLVP